jgi:hypothetical protein
MVAKTTEFNGDIVRQPKLYSSVLGRAKQNAKLAYNVNITVLNPRDLKQKRNVGKWVGEVAIDPNQRRLQPRRWRQSHANRNRCRR